jgi:hypothetical protein
VIAHSRFGTLRRLANVHCLPAIEATADLDLRDIAPRSLQRVTLGPEPRGLHLQTAMGRGTAAFDGF